MDGTPPESRYRDSDCAAGQNSTDRPCLLDSSRRNAGGNRTRLDRVAAGCLAIWLQRYVAQPPAHRWLRVVRCFVCTGLPRTADQFNRAGGSLLSEKRSGDSRRQKQPFRRQHLRNRLLLPQGHRSLRPSFSSSSLSPCTTRTPRLTCVSEGYPLRRLLMVSKKQFFAVTSGHVAPPPRTPGRGLTVRISWLDAASIP